MDTWQFSEVPFAQSIDEVYPLNEGYPLVCKSYNVPVGSSIASLDDEFEDSTLVVTGPYTSIIFHVPEFESEDFEFDGRLRIYRSTVKYDRDMSAFLVYDTEFAVAGENKTVIDYVGLSEGIPLYYTIYFGNAVTGNFAVSPVNCLTTTIAISNSQTMQYAEYETYDSLFGNAIFGLLDPGIKSGNEAFVYKICNAIGRELDVVRDLLTTEENTRFDIPTINANRLTYLDHMLGWPTILIDDEQQRRITTKAIRGLWSTKGSTESLIELVRLVTGWNCEVYRGSIWVLHTWSEESLKPEDWDEELDGVWEDIQYFSPSNTLFAVDTAKLMPDLTEEDDRFCVTSSFSDNGSIGAGNSWKNVNGILLLLYPVSIETRYLYDLRLSLLESMIKLVLPWYTTAKLVVRNSYILPGSPD